MQLRYYILNGKTTIMHIQGFCQQTKPRRVPIRLFESKSELSEYAGKELRMCKACQRALDLYRF